MPAERSLVPCSFLRGNYTLTRELIPLSACFPPAPTLPSKAARGRSGGRPAQGTPLPPVGAGGAPRCSQRGCGSAAAYGFRSAETGGC